VTYRLFGVVYHHGHSATGGHYTVAVARPDGTGWLHFDDETVQAVPAADVVVSEEEVRNGRAGLIGGRERCAYLLFYQRIR
jgi:ubiquitin carboxyl-terminal hydrolase 10